MSITNVKHVNIIIILCIFIVELDFFFFALSLKQHLEFIGTVQILVSKYYS